MESITSKIETLLKAGREAIAALDSVAAVTVASELKKTMDANGQSLPPQVRSEVELVYVQLLFVQLHSLSSARVLSLVKDYLSEGLAIPDYQLAEKIIDHMDFIADPEQRLSFTQNLLATLEHSQSEIGTRAITVQRQPVRPQVGNWIRDYNNFPTPEANRSSIEELHYLDTASNPRTLTADDRDKLLQILGLYDELRYALNELNQMEVPENDDEALEQHQWLSELPGIVVDDEELPPQAPVHPSQQPNPVPAVQPKSQLPQPGPKLAARPTAPPKPTPQPTAPQPRPKPQPAPPRPLNLQDVLLNRDSAPKVGFGRGPIDPLPPQIIPPRRSPGTDIDKKLDELKKRTQKRT